MEMTCGRCAVAVTVIPSRLAKSKSGVIYCSRSCAIATNNKDGRARKTGITTYRKDAIAHYGTLCRVCDYSVEEVLEVHHIDSDRTNNDLANLAVLCPTHHEEVQRGLTDLPRWRNGRRASLRN